MSLINSLDKNEKENDIIKKLRTLLNSFMSGQFAAAGSCPTEGVPLTTAGRLASWHSHCHR